MKKIFYALGIILSLFIIVIVLATVGGVAALVSPPEARLKAPSVLLLSLEGVIIDGEKFLSDLRKYAKDDNIKGVLVKVNSPGGVVGPSQEIYAELKKIRDELEKPVVVVSSSLIASGAYYVALGADKVIVNAGTMVGSIGVIMEFANLSGLYEWAKIRPYTIKAGRYKDAGSPSRDMKPEERELFQSMIDEVHMQFKVAVSKGRKLRMNIVEEYADGRVFTGQTAVRLGFADQVGSYSDAKKLMGELTGLGSDATFFIPPKKRPDFFEMLAEVKNSVSLKNVGKDLIHSRLRAVPLFLMPSFIR